MNPQHIDPNVDLDAAEKEIMGRSASHEKKSSETTTDPVEIFKMEIKAMSEELGIDLEEEPDEKSQNHSNVPPPHSLLGPPRRPQSSTNPVFGPPPGGSPRPATPYPKQRPPDLLREKQLGSLVDDLDLLADDGPTAGIFDRDGRRDSAAAAERDDSDEEDSSSSSDEEDSDEEDSDDEVSDDERESESQSDGEVNSIISDLERELGIDVDAERSRSKRRRRLRMPAIAARPADSSDRHHWRDQRSKPLTEEQERRQHINAVMGDLRHETRTSFGIERERVQDVKASKLEQIGQLRLALEEDGIDCTAVGNPTMESTMTEIDSVLNILRLKNDRNRYSSLAEEVLLGGAEAIETVLDGTRAIPLIGWKPDYRGYHNTLNVKLHRMRYETSSLVGSIIQKHNIGSTARILMEILPSFFLYPRQQRRQRGSPGLHDDPGLQQNRRRVDPGAAYAAIRASDEKRDLTTVSGI